MKRAIILVLDSLGIGASEDAEAFGDRGADTLGHIGAYCAEQGKPLDLPVLGSLGLFHAHAESTGAWIEVATAVPEPIGAWGHARELSSGKDTPSGHWEIAGVPVLFDWGYFPQGENCFPPELLEALIDRAGLPGVLGNRHSSGTVIIEDLGEQHMATGKPIVYTSADSVFQIAAHEGTFGLDRLYEISAIARELVDEYNIGRVIARPFVGEGPGTFERTGNRRDIAVPPPSATVLVKLKAAGGEVISVGKIADIFAHRGIGPKLKANGIDGLFDATMEALTGAGDNTIVFTNFVDFDSHYGHRRDVQGYADALARLDRRMPELLEAMGQGDILLLTADHGCDPTWPGSDHTREHIPVLAYGDGIEPRSLGRRETFADIGQSLADYFDLEPMAYGTTFV
jgi:phosphopentomutase